MNLNYFKSLAWIMGLQWRVSKAYFIWSIGYSVFSGLRPLLAAFALAQLIGLASQFASQQADIEISQAYWWLAILLVLKITSNASGYLDWLLRTKFRLKIKVAVQEILIFKIYELSQSQFDEQDFNTKIGRARDSISNLWAIMLNLTRGISSLIALISGLIVVAFAAPWVALIIIISLIPAILARKRANLIIEKVHKEAMPYNRLANRSSWMLLDPKHMVEVRLLNAFKKITGAWRRHQEEVDQRMHAGNLRFLKLNLVVDLLLPLVNFGANIYFLRQLIGGALGLEQFIFLRGALEESLGGSFVAIQAAQQLHKGFIETENFNEVYKARPAIKNGKIKVKPPLMIEFKGVSFKYPQTENLVLDQLSFVIKPGDHRAIVGRNGAGKTTILKLLMRQYLPTKGSIQINGIDIQRIEKESYYSLISHLSQEIFLPEHLTIRKNLLIGATKEISDEAIWRAADLSMATSFIKNLPKQLDTRMTPSFDDGTDLSTGQRQRLCVARTLLRDADLIILDEPTSAIDAKAEYKIFHNIYSHYAKKTSLIVSHRFSTVRRTDRILVLSEGKIVERGSHEELMDLNGLYREMFEIQAEGYR